MEAPNIHYEKLFEKFKEIETVEHKFWSKTGILGYFCKKYKEKYSCDYEFKFNAPQPSKSFEMFNINKLYINLSSDPEVLKTYIDWLFATKTTKLKRKFTSISFLTKEDNIREFKSKYYSNQIFATIDRSMSLPKELIEKIKDINESILTYGDLAFIMQSDNEQSKSIKNLGIDLSFISRVV